MQAPGVLEGDADGEAEGVPDEVGDGVPEGVGEGGGDDVTVRNCVRAGYHLLAIFWLPESFGCTPSTVSVASLNPVH